MTIRTETRTRGGRSFLGLIKQAWEILQRSAESRVAIEYEQPWKECRSS